MIEIVTKISIFAPIVRAI